MALPTTPPLGHPVPNTRHAISVQLPTWQDMCGMALGEHRVKKAQQIGYPRSFLNRFVKKVHDACVLQLATPLDSCLLYPAPTYATACKKYLCSPLNRIIHPEADKVIIRVVDFDSKEITTSVHEGASTIRLYAVFFPSEYNQLAMSFWRLTGTGISSRLAENLVEGLDRLREVTGLSPLALKQGVNSAGVVAVDRLCKRIVDLLERAPVGPPRPVQVSKSDVFLYQTGMSAIYHCHQLLLKWRGTESVVFGFPYELTLKLLQTYGKGCVFYGFGTPEELDQLEEHLQSELENGRAVQAVWCECPSNPLLRTVNLDRIRQLADRFGFVVVVDDTIGSFANVDVLHVADIIITSLTKSFSGHADVMGGSIVLNPSSPFYSSLKFSLTATYHNDLYAPDAIRLENNSRLFLPRASRMNTSAASLVSLLHPRVSNPQSTVTALYYPSICWSVANYHARMRPPTADFTPGYGGLFTIEFESVSAATSFFNALDVHKGPSLGANVTLAQPYVQTVFTKEKTWAKKYGLNETIVRISVGLEDEKALRRTFLAAVDRADETRRRGERKGMVMAVQNRGCW